MENFGEGREGDSLKDVIYMTVGWDQKDFSISS